MRLLLTIALAAMAAGIGGEMPSAAFVCAIAAYLLGRSVTAADESWTDALFGLGLVGMVAAAFV